MASIVYLFIYIYRSGGHVNHQHEEDGYQEGHRHLALAETLFGGDRPRSLDVIQPHACPHAMTGLADDRNYSLRHAEAGQYFPQGVFGRQDRFFGEIG